MKQTALFLEGSPNVENLQSQGQFRSFAVWLKARLASVAGLLDVRLLGMALPFFCSDLLGKSLAGYQTQLQSVLQLYTGSLLFLVAGIALVLRWRSLKIPKIKLISFLGSFALAGAYIVLALALLLNQDFLYYCAVVLGGAGVVACYSKWFFLFSGVSQKIATTSLLLSFSLGSFLRIVFSFVAPISTLLITAVLVFIGQLVYLKVSESFFDSSASPPLKETPVHVQNSEGVMGSAGFRQLLPFVGMLMVFSFILALVRAINATDQYLVAPNTFNLILRVGFPLVLFVFIAQKKWTIRFTTLYQASLVLVVTAVFLIRLFPESNVFLVVALTSFIRGLIILFLFLLFVQIIQNKKYNPVEVVGIGWGTYVFSQGIGSAVYTFFGLTLDDGNALTLVYLLVLLGSLALLVVGRQGGHPFRVRGFSRAKAEALDQASVDDCKSDKALLSALVANDSDQERLLAMKRRYCLTNREVEILALVCQGRSKRHIAESLVVSENTVRGHVKNLHTKCEVHSKQELIDLLEISSPEPKE